MAASITLLLFTLVTFTVNLCTVSDHKTTSNETFQLSFYAFSKQKPHIVTSFEHCKNRTLTILAIVLAGDVQLNPGPNNNSVYPCAICDLPVTSCCQGVCCDECSVWHHKSCMELCTKDYSLLQRSYVQWLCCKCNSLTVSSFSFRSFDVDQNYYAPIQDPNVTVDSVSSSVFSPMKTSSPISNNRSRSSVRTISESSRLKSTNSDSLHHSKKNNLRILNINCRSIIDKKSEFAAMLEYLKPDIVCGTESWLFGVKPGGVIDKKAILSSEIIPSNYKPYRNDRSSLGGGVFILVREDILAIEEPEYVTNCEINWVKIKLLGNKDLHVGVFYMPHRNENDLNELDRSLTLISEHKDRHVVLLGDFNCPGIDWPTLSVLSPPDKEIHQKLIDISVNNNLTQMQEEPTRESSNLDLYFTSNPSLVKNCSTVPGISDHSIVVVDSVTKPHYNETPKRKHFLFGKADWPSLKSKCSELSTRIKFLSENGITMKDLWETFKTSLMSSVNDNIPSKTFSGKKSLPWLNHKLKKMQRRKQRLYRQAKKTSNWSNYRHYQKECKRAYRRAEWSYINETIEKGLSENNSKPFWRYMKSKKEDNMGISPLLSMGKLVSDSARKAEILVDQFSSVFTQGNDNSKPKVSKYLENPIDKLTITVEGTRKLLDNIVTSKATGPDNIPNRVLKECSSELAPGICELFQRSIDTGCIPDDWTNANVAPLFKKGDRHQASNYRPVSLTSVLSKLLEHIVCKHMLNYFDKNNILTSLNHGFRRGYSCETQLAVTFDDLAKNFDQNLQTDIAILDFSKAFDTVPHRKLLHKLDSYGIRGNLHRWIESFLCFRKMRVVVEGQTSRDVHVVSGVPQGTVLGPLLFLCHINDLPESVSSQVRLFADDCLLYRPIRSRDDHNILQRDLHNLEKWADTWGMRFNATKCYILSVNKSSSYFYDLNNTVLKDVVNNPYLGLAISNDLKWTNHINNICKKASSTIGFIRRNLRHSPTKCRRTAYISLVRSTLEYGAVVWDPFLQSDIDKLEKIQRKAARFISGDYKSRDRGCVTRMLENLDLPLLQERRKQLRLTFMFKVVEGMMPAIPASSYFEPIQRNKRRIRATRNPDFQTSNLVERHELNNNKCYKTTRCNTDIYKHSFFIKTVTDWNQLEDASVSTTTVEAFRASLTLRD